MQAKLAAWQTLFGPCGIPWWKHVQLCSTISAQRCTSFGRVGITQLFSYLFFPKLNCSTGTYVNIPALHVDKYDLWWSTVWTSPLRGLKFNVVCMGFWLIVHVYGLPSLYTAIQWSSNCDGIGSGITRKLCRNMRTEDPNTSPETH